MERQSRAQMTAAVKRALRQQGLRCRAGWGTGTAWSWFKANVGDARQIPEAVRALNVKEMERVAGEVARQVLGDAMGSWYSDGPECVRRESLSLYSQGDIPQPDWETRYECRGCRGPAPVGKPGHLCGSCAEWLRKEGGKICAKCNGAISVPVLAAGESEICAACADH